MSIGIVGAGQFARAFVPLFQAHPGVHDVRLTEAVPERLTRESARHAITTTYPSYEDMLASDVDAVAIFTQRWTHGPLVVQGLEAGKHVYSCVPMAVSEEEIEAIIEAVPRTRLTTIT